MDVATKPGKGRKAPRYLQLAEDLRGQILAAKPGAAQRFPTEAELCKTYDVSRFTVREALRRLQQDGLIARRRGSGTVVQPASARGGALHQPLSNVGEILQYARGARSEFERLAAGCIPAAYAEQVDAELGGAWLRLDGVRCDTSNTPIASIEVFIHPSLADVVDRFDPARSTLFRQITEQRGVPIARVVQEIQAVAAPAAIARKLGIAPRSPCLRVLRCFIDRDGFLFEISASHHPGNRFAYSVHIDVDS
jgi:GntR family transcriptional regulator